MRLAIVVDEMTDIDIDKRFNLIFDVGSHICACYTGFSKMEIYYCQQKMNWMPLQQFLASDNPYEALIHFSLNPVVDVVGYFQLFIGCMLQFPDEQDNERLSNLLAIIDEHHELDEALTNARMMRALLAVAAKYVKSSPSRYFNLFKNAKRVLAHIFKKYPKYLDLNILRTNSKHKSLRFKPEEVELFW